MNISLTNIDSVNAVLQVSIAKADYQEKYDRALKTYRKKVNMPGFRQGTAPVGLMKKMYGRFILAEEIESIVHESLCDYIVENQLNILGGPLPNEEKQQSFNFATESDYDFYFDIALAPEIKLSLTGKDEIAYYKINVDEELVNAQVEYYRSIYGSYGKTEEGAIATDLVKGVISELEDGRVKEDGIVVESGCVMPSYMKDADERDKFAGVKAGDMITFNPGKAYGGNETEIAAMLHIEKYEVEAIAPEFRFEITEVTRHKNAELGQELFDKVFGMDKVKDADEFRAGIREIMEERYIPDSDYKFLLDAKELLEKKVGELQFPDAFLKRWLLVSDEEKSAGSIEASYPKIIAGLKFHLIKKQIANDYDIRIEDDDLKIIAMQAAKAVFARYDMASLPDETVKDYVDGVLKNKEIVRNLRERVMENKIIDLLKTKLGVEEKSVSLDDFRKFFENEEDKQEET
ncbi:MAG: trigger factor family protein [Prevotella sp.]|jgi:trigger factor|nr:trigger factor family protein [Prevotella sp.]